MLAKFQLLQCIDHNCWLAKLHLCAYLMVDCSRPKEWAHFAHQYDGLLSQLPKVVRRSLKNCIIQKFIINNLPTI